MVKVSVIVPVYNVEPYIRKCLETLTKQTLTGIEILIIDDGSTDRSVDIVKEFIQTNNNIKYYKKENGGLADARNYGLLYATGEYIAFLDADDYIQKDMYKLMYERAKELDSDIVECDFYWKYPKKYKIDVGEKYFEKKEALEKARVVVWNKLYKRKLIIDSKITFPKGLQYEDVEFFYKLVPHIDRISFVKQPMLYYIQRKNSLISTHNKKVGDIFTVLDNVILYYKEHKIYEDYKEQLEYTYTRLLLCSSLQRICKIRNKLLRKELLNKTWISLNEKFPCWKQNKILNTEKNMKKTYMLSVNRFTYKIYTLLFKIF
ncbi:MAG: glycosyltransferase [Clostridia bacterium]|nr:glycosyltransferase [Clostridia bacterium]